VSDGQFVSVNANQSWMGSVAHASGSYGTLRTRLLFGRMIHWMPDKQPIDYARAESTDVVRKKFRRRVVMFVVATIVMLLIGIGWLDSWKKPRLLIGKGWQQTTSSILGWSGRGWIVVTGPVRTTSLNGRWTTGDKKYGHHSISTLIRISVSGSPKWIINVRYRTLVILAMIPWMITLIRMNRSWKRKQVPGPEY